MIDRRKIIYTVGNVYKNIKDSLESTKGREFLIFLFFFFVAGAFWLLQTLNDEYETEFSVPVRLRNVPDNVVVTSEPPSNLRIKVKDKGTVLLNYVLTKNFFPVYLNFDDYGRNTNNQVRILSPEYRQEVLRQLNQSTRLLSITPDTLEYIYATGQSKVVPVRFKGAVSAGREYFLSDTIFKPDTVRVYAPSAILDTIRAAYIQNVYLENISDTLRINTPIAPIRGAKFVPDVTQLILPVDIYTEKTVEVPIYGTNFPPDKVLRTFPSKMRVTFKLGLSRYKEVTADFLSIHIPYQELIQLGTDKYTVELSNLPPGLSVVRITPPQIDFLIEQLTIQ